MKLFDGKRKQAKRAKEDFVNDTYNKLRSAIEVIQAKADVSDVYAISFWHSYEEDEPRYPQIIVSYNTISHYRDEAKNASSESEARWNYAFWLQDEIEEIGGMNDEFLSVWFKESSYYYSDKESEDTTLLDRTNELGERFDEEFIEVIIAIVQRLFGDDVVSRVFGKNIPILLHELEYYDKPIEWTVRANPKELVDEFKWAVFLL